MPVGTKPLPVPSVPVDSGGPFIQIPGHRRPEGGPLSPSQSVGHEAFCSPSLELIAAVVGRSPRLAIG